MAGILDDRVAVVTGASRGIGRAIAGQLAAAGAAVALLSRSSDIHTAAQAAEAAGSVSRAVVCDVTDDQSVAAALCEVREELGQVDILVNCAGRHVVGRLEDFPAPTYADLFDVNVLGAVRTTRGVLPDMRQRKCGRIVNIASTAGRAGSLYQCPYNTAKHALLGFTRAAALELAPLGVTVNAVCPGWVATDMMTGLVAGQARLREVTEEETAALLLARVPTGRLVDPEEVAALCLYLVSPAAASVTGQAYTIDGGLLTA